MKKTYYLVAYEGKNKGVNAAIKSILSKEDAQILLQDAQPTIVRKKEKYQVLSRRLFEYDNTDGSKTLFIICDCNQEK